MEEGFIPQKHIEAFRESFQKELGKAENFDIPAEKVIEKAFERYKKDFDSAKDDARKTTSLADEKEAAEEEVSRLGPEEHDKQIKELIHIFQSKGPLFAFSILKKMSNPHLMDDFHRSLVYEFTSGRFSNNFKNN